MKEPDTGSHGPDPVQTLHDGGTRLHMAPVAKLHRGAVKLAAEVAYQHLDTGVPAAMSHTPDRHFTAQQLGSGKCDPQAPGISRRRLSRKARESPQQFPRRHSNLGRQSGQCERLLWVVLRDEPGDLQ